MLGLLEGELVQAGELVQNDLGDIGVDGAG